MRAKTRALSAKDTDDGLVLLLIPANGLDRTCLHTLEAASTFGFAIGHAPATSPNSQGVGRTDLDARDRFSASGSDIGYLAAHYPAYTADLDGALVG